MFQKSLLKNFIKSFSSLNYGEVYGLGDGNIIIILYNSI